MKTRSKAAWNLFAAVVFVLCGPGASPALSQGEASALRGTWTATAGGRTLQGSWGAEISPSSPNAAQGYWTLVNESGERVLEGTWSAKKTGTRWHGTWSARVAKGPSLSGVWDAEIADAKTKTFAQMLAQTLETEVSGSWQSGRYGGNWWLLSARRNKAAP